MSRSTIRLLITVAVAYAVSGALFAQLASTSSEEQLRRRIAELQSETGLVRPAELVDPLRTLATLYQQAGDHPLALATLEEARYVTRAHQGLSSGDEALLLRQQILSERALGNHWRVWDLEQSMVTIARKNPDDIRMAQVFRELAEDRADALQEYAGGGFPPEIELGCYYVPGFRRYDDTRAAAGSPPPDVEGSCFSGQSMYVTRRLRAEIFMYYADAIEVIVKSGDYSSQELRDLEKRTVLMFPQPFDAMNWRVGTDAVTSGDAPLVAPPSFCDAASPGGVDFGVRRSTEFTTGDLSDNLDELLASEVLGSCLEPVISGEGYVTANVGGWVSLVRLVAYEIRSGASAAARARALTDLADWHFLQTSGGSRLREENEHRAIELYERAYRELEQDGAVRTVLFAPPVPVTFAPNPFSYIETAESSRYIDVSFDITKGGAGERIEILDASKDATRAEKQSLIRLIESTRFRPRFVDGKPADSAPVVVRYRLGP
jgi:hypothetical protein